jgi:bacterial/archaeal transporter family protein
MDSDPFVALTIRSFSVIVGLLILGVGMGKMEALIHASPRMILFFALSGLLAGLLGTWCYLAALKIGASSRVVPISATYPLVTAILSCLLLREGFTLSRILGTVLIVAGISLLK